MKDSNITARIFSGSPTTRFNIALYQLRRKMARFQWMRKIHALSSKLDEKIIENNNFLQSSTATNTRTVYIFLKIYIRY